MIIVTKYYVNYVTIFTISRITNVVSLVHKPHALDIRINMGLESIYILEKRLFIQRK